MSWLDAARAIPASAVVASLGMTVSHRKYVGPCRGCGATQRSSKDKRPPMLYDKGGHALKCFACGMHFSGLWLAACAVFGRPPQAGDDWSSVRAWLVGESLLEGEGERITLKAMDLAPTIEDIPPPPVYQVAALLRSCVQPCEDEEVGAYLALRGIPLSAPCGALPRLDVYPEWWPWGRDYPLLVGGYDTHGNLRSCHARTIYKHPIGKTRWPRGYAAGWLFLDPVKARPMLQRKDHNVSAVLICEGLTDYLAASCAAASDPSLAVIGGASGSWRALVGAAIPSHAVIFIATDQDAVGERYAREISDALAGYQLRRIDLSQFATTNEDHHHVVA